MKLVDLKRHLTAHPGNSIRFALPTGTNIPPHAHVTEVARVEKRFVDCGGTFRSDLKCRLQVWVADDTDHRLDARTLLRVLEISSPLFESGELEVDVECEAPFVSHFPISGVECRGDSLVLTLGIAHTDCLAKDRCQRPANLSDFLSLKTATFRAN